MTNRVSRRDDAHGSPRLELYLSSDMFATGRRLSGVVVLRLDKPIHLRSLSISVSGNEIPTGASLARTLGRGGVFFDREALLSGAIKPRLTSDRVSLLWNAILGRNTGREISSGEHTYPFSISLPASLPPSYEGRAGKIDYRVTARLQPAVGRATKVSRPVNIVFVPRRQRGRPVALSYPSVDGAVHSSEINMSLEMPERMVAIGGAVEGRFVISNPRGIAIPRVCISLDVCEWVRLSVDREIQRERVDVNIIKPEDPTASTIVGPFSLKVPKTTPPTLEGAAISVIWLLKLSLETEPVTEFKTPITVYRPLSSP